LVNQENYLKGQTLVKTTFKETQDSDHTHCAFCWEKFSNSADTTHIGYRVIDGSWWICEKCFEDFKEQFDWVIER